MEAQAVVIKILQDNSIPEKDSKETKPLEWIKEISCNTFFFPPKTFPAAIVEDADPAFETFSPADQSQNIYEKQFINVAVVIKTKNKNEKDFSLEDYMALKTDLKAKANAVNDLLKVELAKVKKITGGTFGASSIDDIKISSVPALICTTLLTLTVLK